MITVDPLAKTLAYLLKLPTVLRWRGLNVEWPYVRRLYHLHASPIGWTILPLELDILAGRVPPCRRQ
jgi:hypothetical protein